MEVLTMTKKQSIDSISIPKPCAEPWDNMHGSDLKRFCGSCQKDVFNLSSMSRRKANRLIRKSGGRICVRYARLPNGKMVTTDSSFYQISKRTAGIAAGVLATTITMSALTYAQGEPMRLGSPQSSKAPSQTETIVPNSYPDLNENTSQISILVVDETGVAIPGAKVELVDDEGKKKFMNYTGSDGFAHFSLLPKSGYKVKAMMEGFRAGSRTLRLSMDVEPTVAVALSAGSVTGAIVDGGYEIPVFDLIADNDIEGFSKALASGFSLKTKDTSKRTALHIAVYHLRVELVRMLIAKGADVNAKDVDDETPLVYLADDVGEDDEDVAEILRMLIEKDADVNSANQSKETLLMEAAYYDDVIVVELLLKAGAKTDLKNGDGKSAYQLIEDSGVREIFHRYGVFN